MTFTSAMIGGGLGFAAQIFSNAIRKVPLSRVSCVSRYGFVGFCIIFLIVILEAEPWLHAGLFIAGCWAGNYYPKLELKLVTEINEIRTSKGMPPLVGTNAWIRYQAPEDENLELKRDS